jgi:hypothetical protein
MSKVLNPVVTSGLAGGATSFVISNIQHLWYLKIDFGKIYAFFINLHKAQEATSKEEKLKQSINEANWFI